MCMTICRNVSKTVVLREHGRFAGSFELCIILNASLSCK